MLPPSAPSFLALAGVLAGAAFWPCERALGCRRLCGRRGGVPPRPASSMALETPGRPWPVPGGGVGRRDRPASWSTVGARPSSVAFLVALDAPWPPSWPPGPARPPWPARSPGPSSWLRLRRGGPALRAADREPGREDPPDPGHRLAADQPAVVEEPGVLAVELLERVVGEHHGPGPLGDAQHEGVAAADGAGRRRDHLAVAARPARSSSRSEGSIAVLEGGVDHHDDLGVGVLLGVGPHRLVQLRQAGSVRPSVARLDPSTTTWCCQHSPPVNHSRRPGVAMARQPMARSRRSACSSWCRAALPVAGLADSAPAHVAQLVAVAQQAGAGGRGRRTTPPCSRAPLAARPPRSASG